MTETPAPRDRPLRSLVRLLSSLVPAHRRGLWLALGLCLASGGLGLVQPVLFGRIVDDLLQHRLPEIGRHIFEVFGVFAVMGALQFAHNGWLSLLGERIARDVRLRFQRAMLAQELEYFTTATIGEALTRLGPDTNKVADLVKHVLSTFLQDLVILLVGGGMMIYSSPSLGLLAFAVVVPIVIVTVYLGQRLNDRGHEAMEADERGISVFHEGMSGIETVRLFVREEHEASRYRRMLDAAYRAGVRLEWLAVGFVEASRFVLATAVVFLLWRASTLVAATTITLGTATTFFLYLSATTMAITRLTHGFTETRLAAVSASRVLELAPPRRDLAATARLGGAPRRLGLEHVSHRYPGRDADSLTDVTLTFERGKRYAVVGSSGAGKTTFLRTLAGLLRPASGAVRVDGHRLDELDPADLREHLAVVPQEPFLFRASLRENVRYGRLDATDAEVAEVMRRIGLGPFVDGLPHGLDTEISERGLQLSGGQRQRLAIARALLRDPAFLLFDEATSALDSEADFIVQDAVRSLREPRPGLILISHRLASIQDADEILVLEHGRVVERGSHRELLGRRGRYAELVARQVLVGDVELAEVSSQTGDRRGA